MSAQAENPPEGWYVLLETAEPARLQLWLVAVPTQDWAEAMAKNASGALPNATVSSTKAMPSVLAGQGLKAGHLKQYA